MKELIDRLRNDRIAVTESLFNGHTAEHWNKVAVMRHREIQTSTAELERQQAVIDETYRRNVEHCEEIKRLTEVAATTDLILKAVNETVERLTGERDNLIAQRTAETTEFARLVDHCKAERDAAFAMSHCQCGTDEACANLARLTAERDALKEGLDGWHKRYLDCEVERDALKVSDKRNFEKFVTACLEKDALKAEIVRLAGEATVLRELLAESLSVIKTIDGADECECDLLETLCGKIKAAIVPQPSREQQAANEKQLSIDVDLMARGKKLYFVYPPDSEKTGDLL